MNENIWQAAQSISSGYKNASSDYLAHEWVLGILVRHLGSSRHKDFAKRLARKLKGRHTVKQVEKILLEALVQAVPLAGRKL